MLARQTSDECSPDYRVQPGDPCVPAGTQDVLSCPDIEARDIEVVGADVYRLDGNDQDGWACETSTVTSGGDDPDRIDAGSFGKPVGLTIVVTLGIIAGALLWRRYREASEDDERWDIEVMVLGAITFGAIGATLGILRWA